MKNPHKRYSQEWHEQEDFNALARLYIRGIITDAEKEKAKARMKKRYEFERAEDPLPTPTRRSKKP